MTMISSPCRGLAQARAPTPDSTLHGAGQGAQEVPARLLGGGALSGRVRRVAADRLQVAIRSAPPTRRHYDLDNLLSRLKSGFDGLVDAPGVDDSRWSLRIRDVEPVKGRIRYRGGGPMGNPRSRAVRPRKMIIPPAFGTTCDMDTRPGLRMREAVDALVTGSGDWDDMMGCESELIVGIHLQRIAMARPTGYTRSSRSRWTACAARWLRWLRRWRRSRPGTRQRGASGVQARSASPSCCWQT